jgi:hypothetical protein
MALTIAPSYPHVGAFAIGPRRAVLLKVTFDSSYATGGVAFDPARFGIEGKPAMVVISPRTAGSRPFDVAYDRTNKKLVVMREGATSLKSFVAAGAAAGNVTVTGIATTDQLLSVVRLDRDATAANINISDITSEFTISATDTINNTAGTNTTGDSLLVLVARPANIEVPNATNLSTLVCDVLIVSGDGI